MAASLTIFPFYPISNIQYPISFEKACHCARGKDQVSQIRFEHQQRRVVKPPAFFLTWALTALL
jgi:hypothetical protein